MAQLAYDNDRMGTRQARDIARAVTLAGTNAAAVDVVRVACPDDCAIDKLYMVLTTGATSAGLSLILNKSLAGTGALSPLGTVTLTTHASNAVVGTSFLATSAAGTTILNKGDVLVLQQVAGTVATSPVANLTLGWREKFSNAND